MTDDELRGNLWHLAAARTKNKRPHDVPLSPQTRSVLGGLPRLVGSPYLFTTTGATPVSGFQKARASLAAKMEEIAESERGEAVAILRWGFHDLRRTAATGMARLGIPVRVTEAALNHVSGIGGGLVAVYQRYDFATEKCAAIEAWGRFVAELVGAADGGTVVPLRRST